MLLRLVISRSVYVRMNGLPSTADASIRCNKNLNLICELPWEGFVPFRINFLPAPLAHEGHSMLAEIKVFLEAELG